MLRQNHTDPSWMRTKTRGSGKTADQLLTGKLDWDGRESPAGTDNDRDVVLSPKLCSDEDTGPPRYAARPPRDRSKSKASAIQAVPPPDPAALEVENLLLKRQIEVLLGQVSSSGNHKLPQLNLRSIAHPPSPNTFLTEPPATERPLRQNTRGGLSGRKEYEWRDPSFPISPRQVSGAMTDRPRRSSAQSAQLRAHTGHRYEITTCDTPVPRQRGREDSNVHRHGEGSHKRSHRHDRRLSTAHAHGHRSPRSQLSSPHLGVGSPHHDDSEREREALQQEVDALKFEHKTTQEKIWGLEECLSAKDAELLVKEAELNHLRFLIGVKEGNEAQAERQLAFLQGKHTEDFVVNPEDNMAEVGKFTLRQIDSDIYRFEENLKEYEDHLRAGDEEEYEGLRLLTAIDDEKERRKVCDRPKGSDCEQVL